MCLMLTGEARLWYESFRLINADWTELKKTHSDTIIQRLMFMYIVQDRLPHS